METEPLVSICIPVYNAGQYLEPCLRSAVNQSYTNLEILVLDDGSTDQTPDIVSRFQLEYPQVRFVKNPQNVGMVNNWNQCVAEAKGDWIKFLFQDDLLAPTCVQEMVSACQREGVQVALCSRTFMLHDNLLPSMAKDFTNGTIKKAESVFGNCPFILPAHLARAVKKHLIHNFLGEPTCFLFHKQLYQHAGGFNPALAQLVDYEFIVRLGLVHGLAFLPNPLARFRVHEHSQSSNNKRDEVGEAGDLLILQHLFLQHPGFTALRSITGTELLKTNLRHIYYSTCKRLGEKRVNKGLARIKQAYPELRELRYNFLKYVIYRRRMKQWYHQIEQERIEQ